MATTHKAILTTIVRTRLWQGVGYIAGVSPGLVTVNGSPAGREVIVTDRLTHAIVASTFSAADGSYRINGLDPTRLYDVVARDYVGVYNDVIRASVTPAT